MPFKSHKQATTEEENWHKIFTYKAFWYLIITELYPTLVKSMNK